MSIDLPLLRTGLQRQLFPALQEELGPLGHKDRLFVQVLALLPQNPGLERYAWSGNGRPPVSRLRLFQSLVAKAVYGFATTAALIDELRARPTLRRLCGWESASEIPDQATFSRAFADFAAAELPQQIHETMVRTHCGPKLAGHSSHDSTALEARERPSKPPAPSAPASPVARRKRCRPKKGQEPPPPPPTRLQVQPHRSLAENLADLPRAVTAAARSAPRVSPNTGVATNSMRPSSMGTSRSAWS